MYPGEKAARVTWVGFFTNLILSTAKIIAGIWGEVVPWLQTAYTPYPILSQIHRLSSSLKSHRKTKTVTTLMDMANSKPLPPCSSALHSSSSPLEYFIREASKIYEVLNGEIIETAHLFGTRYGGCFHHRKRGLILVHDHNRAQHHSPAVIANGWHHRSDAFSSIGTLIAYRELCFWVNAGVCSIP